MKQLEARNGLIPVKLECENAHLASPDRLDNFSCLLRNNTNKAILAGSVSYSVVVESSGKVVGDAHFQTFDTVIHPDFYDASKSIQPAAARDIGPPGPMFYANSVIKELKIEIEYIEFDDKTTLGAPEKGSEITDIREGAARYRDWLFQRYRGSGRSAETIIAILQ
ncbi:MAG: hypothetical protein WAM70_00655, partial [Pyrinomonadaceae bacterium]